MTNSKQKQIYDEMRKHPKLAHGYINFYDDVIVLDGDYTHDSLVFLVEKHKEWLVAGEKDSI